VSPVTFAAPLAHYAASRIKMDRCGRSFMLG
jgi:hypothetical protein